MFPQDTTFLWCCVKLFDKDLFDFLHELPTYVYIMIASRKYTVY